MESDSDQTVEACVFCAIARGEEEATVILQDDDFVCFWDISPAAPHHYLVVPRQHIVNCLSLHTRHIKMVERMADMGRAALHSQGIVDMDNTRLGFHVPPYTSVDHLHLHVLAPASEISLNYAYKFIPRSDFFITEDSLRTRLEKILPPCFCSSLDCLLQRRWRH
ncbi:adenosine 5'-monophosphoramidase HINT3-like isoform X1 [Synchiropus splendidus]|uniref:adenosine 5'-monophosphoramidase HINT3-like isoform X1 n=1 Tax=Synchiropus splendidus TaxID=270530 RepID=UPI00237E9451|nr:adenosine 5'-monophosphoramidase HINT3-like isoform X1 [Synchiropus splendidus]